uniref:pectinesterase n=1 Tax=Aegilops tauschii TaxID=37682 RepID=N1R5F9_AEGTA
MRSRASTSRSRGGGVKYCGLWAAAIASVLLAILLASTTHLPASPTDPLVQGRRRRRQCDEEARWVAGIASQLNATLVLTVDHLGCGNFSSVQKAVDAVPDHGAAGGRTLLAVGAGIFREKVVVWGNKTGVTLHGRGNLNSTVAWNDTAASSAGSTPSSATFTVLAAGFVAYNIQLPEHGASGDPGASGGQAVALRVAGARQRSTDEFPNEILILSKEIVRFVHEVHPAYARQLDRRQAAPFMDVSYIDGDQWAVPPLPVVLTLPRQHGGDDSDHAPRGEVM